MQPRQAWNDVCIGAPSGLRGPHAPAYCESSEMEIFIVCASAAWIGVLLLPWRPWSTRERLELPAGVPLPGDLSDVTALIPARNEAETIVRTLAALRSQGNGLRIVLVDDQSSDGTAARARGAFDGDLAVIDGTPLPDGWIGKLWALEQGRKRITTDLILLLDADIELAPGIAAALKRKLLDEHLDLVSIMAELRMRNFWEKMLVPAFVFFFKLLYPFALGNSARSRIGVAAGGCILVRADALGKIGAFESLRHALIDDCTLARQLKIAGSRTWIGLSHAVRSHRAYAGLAEFWNMVARSAFTQLRCSSCLLVATTTAMVLLFWVPLAGLAFGSPTARLIAAAGLCAMGAVYAPTLRYYGRSPLWILLLPVIGGLFLMMTWTSVLRYWRGRRSEWKGRVYAREQSVCAASIRRGSSATRATSAAGCADRASGNKSSTSP
jgi:hopene-associated glycosyltransferase HpnB